MRRVNENQRWETYSARTVSVILPFKLPTCTVESPFAVTSLAARVVSEPDVVFDVFLNCRGMLCAGSVLLAVPCSLRECRALSLKG